MSSMQPPRIHGSWQGCARDGCNLIFFRYEFGHQCYSLSDKIGVCPLCIFSKKTENGTHRKARHDISEYHHKSVESKPESDTL